MSEQGGRYQRSFSGLVVAIVVTLIGIAVFVAFRATFRDEVETRPQAVDYLETVGFSQDAGTELVYPRSLPEGWMATSIDLDPGDPPDWGIGMLTEDEAFVGLRQEDADLDDLLATYVDEDRNEIQKLDDVELTSDLADRWQRYADSGGDLAFAAEVGEQVVLVYGSAGEDDLRAVVEALTTDPVG